MELTDVSKPAIIQHLGNEIVDIPAGTHFRIETSPDGGEILDAEVPEGKSWKVKIHIEIIESDE